MEQVRRKDGCVFGERKVMNKTIDIDLDEFHPAVVETSEKIKFLCGGRYE